MSIVEPRMAQRLPQRDLVASLLVLPPSFRLRIAKGGELGAAGLLAGTLTLGFLALSAWWIANDARVPDFDTAKHIGWALDMRDALVRGELLDPFNRFTAYPPLVHTVGAISLLVGGVNVGSAVLGANLVFVPLLVLALYRTGRLMSGTRAGVLAVVFALGAPLVVSQAHVFVLELPETALVAAALWGLLASERFACAQPALAAGVACGLGVLTKPTFPFFIAGALAVMLARGGLRNRRGVALFILAALVVGAPWYVRHVGQLGQTLAYATQPPHPPRLSLNNAMWFTWDQVNGQLFLPLYAFALAGTGWAVWRWRGGLRAGDHTPELVVGGVVAYLGLTYGMSVHAPYYSLPALPYEALLGTLWIAALRPRARTVAAVAVGAVAALNTVAVGIHPLGHVSIRLPGRTPQGFIQSRRLTLWRSYSWPVGPPQSDGRLLDLFRALHARGVRRLEVDHRADRPDFDVTGVVLLARMAGLPRYAPDRLRRHDVFVLRASGRSPWPPCRRLSDGSGVVVLRRRGRGPGGVASACPRSP